MTPLLIVEGLSKTYGGPNAARLAVDDLSFCVHPGEIVGLIGPNGAGKTTTLSMLAGITRPTAGTARFSQDLIARRQGLVCVGFSPQVPAFHPFFSAREELRRWGALAGVPVKELAERVHEALSRVDLADRAMDGLNTFSRGMLQRVSLAQALLHQPSVLLLDEPTSSLDPVAHAKTLNILQEERHAGRSILVSSHNLTEVSNVCDRVLLVKSGRIVEALPIRSSTELCCIDISCAQVPPKILRLVDRATPTADGFRLTLHISSKRAVLAALTDDMQIELRSVSEARTDLYEAYRRHFDD